MKRFAIITLILFSPPILLTSSVDAGHDTFDMYLDNNHFKLNVSNGARWNYSINGTLNGTSNTTYEIFSNCEMYNRMWEGIYCHIPNEITTDIVGKAEFQLLFIRSEDSFIITGDHQLSISVKRKGDSYWSSDYPQSHVQGDWNIILIILEYRTTGFSTIVDNFSSIDDYTIEIPVVVRNMGNGPITYDIVIHDIEEWNEAGFQFEFNEGFRMSEGEEQYEIVTMSIPKNANAPNRWLTIEVVNNFSRIPISGDTVTEVQIFIFNSGGLSPLGLETKLGVVMTWLSIGTISVIGIIALLQWRDKQQASEWYHSSEE